MRHLLHAAADQHPPNRLKGTTVAINQPTSSSTTCTYRIEIKGGGVETITAHSYGYNGEAASYRFERDGVTVLEISRHEVRTIRVLPPTTDEQLAFDLGDTLRDIEDADTDYAKRYGLVLGALALAHKLGIPAGIRIDENQPEWPVVHIELPTGGVTWHMPQHPTAWDGHDTEEKYRRCRAYAEAVGA